MYNVRVVEVDSFDSFDRREYKMEFRTWEEVLNFYAEIEEDPNSAVLDTWGEEEEEEQVPRGSYYKVVYLSPTTGKSFSIVWDMDRKLGWSRSVFSDARILILPANEVEFQMYQRGRISPEKEMRSWYTYSHGNKTTQYYPNRHLRKRGKKMAYKVIERIEREG